ncbi:prephenate dehydrogenase [Ruminococcus flavefaciens]|uniref:Prephenate dehydrogenase n=1 Tax=Ruminococcus flavefaciens TaxID=1265 RepID=A0A1K1NFV6_RUMFL|nr:prephenate dehydrogenase [Ruminococcus flavefaciens]SFW34145.1 prephenate dehydrogenase [Ruminococcus flavefaciens]
MNILVVGLGLIGGSLCKALKKYTYHTVTGCDLNHDIENAALRDVALDNVFDGSFEGYDLIIIALFPQGSEMFFKENAPKISKNTLITDVCGIKGEFSDRMKAIAEANGLRYVGIHPMAGKEFGGYYNSTADLFVKANFIIAPFEDSDEKDTELLKNVATEIGAGKIVVTSPENHDKMIAYTSQLAHIVSSAYVKSPELGLECGFSGGSFQDMTRIATMNEKMWTDLFMQNRENLQYELDTLIANLNKYSEALKSGDKDKMKALIAEGRELKEENLRHRVGQPN